MAEDIFEDQLKGLKRAARRCKKYSPVQSALAEFYLDHKSAAHEDWLKLAIHHYEVALKSDPLLWSENWELGSLWAVLGEYERASVCFERLSNTEAPTESRYPGQGEATSCFSACNLLGSLSDRPKVDLKESGKKAASRLVLVDSALIIRAEWLWLQQWACAVAISGKGIGEAELNAHRAGCLIVEFRQRPYVQRRIDRMLKLSGLIAGLSTSMLENKLSESVDILLSQYAGRSSSHWPDILSGGELESQFVGLEIDSLRSCVFSSDLVLQHEWRTPELKGIWSCRAELTAPYREDVSILEFDVELKQQNDTVFILFPKIEGFVENKSMLVLLLNGHHMTTVYWQNFAGRRDGPEARISGTPTLSKSYDSMKGTFSIKSPMDHYKTIVLDVNRVLAASPSEMIDLLREAAGDIGDYHNEGGTFTFTRK